MMGKQIVGITNCFSYNFEEVYNAVKQACLSSDFPDVENKYILVKPNILSDSNVEDCITTHPEVVRAVIRILKEKGASKIIVGDSPGLQNPSFRAENCKIGQVCKEEQVEFVDFTQKTSVRKINNTNKRIPITDYAFDCDMVFSVCKFKTHQFMYATGAVKNLFGLIPGINKSKCHLTNPSKESFAKFIVDLHEVVKPQFCVMDAIIGMEGPGPANGNPKPVNLVLASSSCFACDWAQALIMGYNPQMLPILSEASKRGLISKWIEYPILSASELKIEKFKTIQIEKQTRIFKNLIFPFFTRSLEKARQRKQIAPEFNYLKCIKCKRCINICPAKALTFKEDKVNIDYTKCIRCYCCHEMCPVEAITVTNNGD